MLRAMIGRLRACEKVEPALETILADVTALLGAAFGTVQLYREDEEALLLVGHRGLPHAFLERFWRVSTGDGSVCLRAMRNGGIAVVPDVEVDEAFKPHLDVARPARVRAVHSSALLSAGARLVGLVSAHFPAPHTPTPIEIDMMQKYCPLAADHLVHLLKGADVQAISERFVASVGR